MRRQTMSASLTELMLRIGDLASEGRRADVAALGTRQQVDALVGRKLIDHAGRPTSSGWLVIDAARRSAEEVLTAARRRGLLAHEARDTNRARAEAEARRRADLSGQQVLSPFREDGLL